MATLKEEKKLWRKGYKYIACLDEAGRGSLAGPVVAAAVMMNSRIFTNLPRISRIREICGKFEKIREIKDSKRLSPRAREKFYKILTTHPGICWAIGRVSEKLIDKINILEATKLAMKRAIENLEKKYLHGSIGMPRDRAKRGRELGYSHADFLILDGNFKIDLPIPQKSIIKADQKVFSCIAASILAKVWRDRIMKRYHKKYPQYGFEKHKGYPTKFHLKMLKKYGPCQIHRKSFISQILAC